MTPWVDGQWTLGVPIYQHMGEWQFDDTKGLIDISEFIIYEQELFFKPDVDPQVKKLLNDVIRAYMISSKAINRMIYQDNH